MALKKMKNVKPGKYTNEYLKLLANKEIDPAMIPPKSDGFGCMPRKPIQKQFNIYDPNEEFFRAEDFI